MRIQLSIVYKYITFFSFLIICNSCGPEPDDKVFFNNIQVENTSTKNFTILAYDNYDESFNKTIKPAVLKETIEIGKNSKGPIVVCETRFSPINNSTYFPNSGSDSIVIKFEDGKRYFSMREENSINNDKWITNKSSLLAIFEKDVRKEGDVYIYTITQEDYENAHILP